MGNVIYDDGDCDADHDDDYDADYIVAKSVKISTNQFLSQNNSTKNKRFTTFLNTRQNSVNAFEIS